MNIQTRNIVDDYKNVAPVVRIGRIDDKTGRANEYGLWATNAGSPPTYLVLSTVENRRKPPKE